MMLKLFSSGHVSLGYSQTSCVYDVKEKGRDNLRDGHTTIRSRKGRQERQSGQLELVNVTTITKSG